MVTALILVGAVIFFVSAGKRQSGDKVFVHVESVKLPDGWGYNIVSGEKVYINQIQIPAVPGRQVFVSEEQALETGRLVIYKLAHKKIPSITVAELDSLGVSWKK